MPKFLILPDRIVNFKSIKHVYKGVGEFSNPDDPEELGGKSLVKPAIFLQIRVFSSSMKISYGYQNEGERDSEYEQIECALHREIFFLPWKERRDIVSLEKVVIN